MNERSSGAPATPAQRLWGGRFTAEPSADMDRLNRSLPVDRRLWREDIVGSQAWARARRSSASIVSMAASAEAQATGLPP